MDRRITNGYVLGILKVLIVAEVVRLVGISSIHSLFFLISPDSEPST
jgi:hypothetical protein